MCMYDIIVTAVWSYVNMTNGCRDSQLHVHSCSYYNIKALNDWLCKQSDLLPFRPIVTFFLTR